MSITESIWYIVKAGLPCLLNYIKVYSQLTNKGQRSAEGPSGEWNPWPGLRGTAESIPCPIQSTHPWAARSRAPSASWAEIDSSPKFHSCAVAMLKCMLSTFHYRERLNNILLWQESLWLTRNSLCNDIYANLIFLLFWGQAFSKTGFPLPFSSSPLSGGGRENHRTGQLAPCHDVLQLNSLQMSRMMAFKNKQKENINPPGSRYV